MFRAEDLKAGYLHLMAWRQAYDQDITIPQSLTEGECGQFYQDIHPLLTLENVKAISPDFTQVTHPNWLVTKTYRKGERVDFNGQGYRAKVDNTGYEPDSNPVQWDEYDAFGEWLENKTMASNLNALQSIYTEKVADRTARNILQQKVLFDGAGRLSDTIKNTDRLVGMEIVPIRSSGATVKIEKIGLQFTGTGSVKLYLMHSSRSAPIKEFELTRTRSNGMEWFPQTNLYLPYLSDEVDAGGSWYLCYKQTELPESVEAINKSRDWSKAPCSSCNSVDISSYRAWSKFIEVYPFKNEVSEDPMELWDIATNIYTNDKNYGINIQLSVECDVTDIFLENRLSFQTVIGLQMAADMIQEFAYNPSYNITRATQSFTKNELLYELNGSEGNFVNSVNYKLKKAIEAVKVDMRSMSRVCMQCRNGGVKYRTV